MSALLDQKLAAEEFAAKREARLSRDDASYQSTNPIASDLHDCDRYQTMRLVAWQVRPRPDARGLEVMEDGRLLEAHMIRQLQDEGWEIVEQQAPFEVLQPLEPGGPKLRILSGRMDGKIRIGPGRGWLIPIEFKSTSEYTVDAIESEDDLKTHSEWTRKWWRQLQIYMLGTGYEQALLVLGFRGKRKVIVVNLDYDEAERILKVATQAVRLFGEARADGIDERTVDAWLAGRSPTRAPGYHPDRVVCGRCPFYNRACYPPAPAEGERQLRPDLESLVDVVVATKGPAKDYERARKQLVAQVEGYEYTVAGKHVVRAQKVERKMKEQPAKPAYVQTYWKAEVVGDAGEEE